MRRRAALYQLCQFYQAKALQLFRAEQSENSFWTNRTNTAYNTVYGDARITASFASWGLAHSVEYGVYLELANDRRYESLRPIIASLTPEFMQDCKRLFGD